MTDVLPFIIAGLTVGSVYALAGSGLVLTFKTSGIFNFGHGALATVGVYVFYFMYVEAAAAARPLPARSASSWSVWCWGC